jgi:hypothetical protein
VYPPGYWTEIVKNGSINVVSKKGKGGRFKEEEERGKGGLRRKRKERE